MHLVFLFRLQLHLGPTQHHLVQAVCSMHLQDERVRDAIVGAGDAKVAGGGLVRTSQELCLPIEQILQVAVGVVAQLIAVEHDWM